MQQDRTPPRKRRRRKALLTPKNAADLIARHNQRPSAFPQIPMRTMNNTGQIPARTYVKGR